MKTFMLIVDGLGDDPIPALRGLTPLEAAHDPHIEDLAREAERGFAQTVLYTPPESLACIAGLLGYPPETLSKLGRAAFEARAAGIELGPADLAFRCNIVALAENGHAIADFTAGALADEEAARILATVGTPHGWELHRGQSYRNLLVVRNAGCRAADLTLFEPHMHQGRSIAEILPRASSGQNEKAEALAENLRSFISSSHAQISSAAPANGKKLMLWLWSPSEQPGLPPFEALHGIKGAVVAGLDFMKGLARTTRMRVAEVAGATGYLDTDYAAKGRAAIALFRGTDAPDLVLAHVNATDEAAHARNPQAKAEAISRIDAEIAGPVVRFLMREHPHGFTVIVCGDHKTSSTSGLHGDAPVPYLIYRDDMKKAPDMSSKSPNGKFFSENMRANADIPAGDLLKKALS